MTPDQVRGWLDAQQKRHDEAHSWVSDLCTGERQWQMRVPVDLGDSDIRISEALTGGERALAALRALLDLADQYRTNCDPTSTQAQVAEIFRAALAAAVGGDFDAQPR